jgi:xylose isomerase
MQSAIKSCEWISLQPSASHAKVRSAAIFEFEKRVQQIYLDFHNPNTAPVGS